MASNLERRWRQMVSSVEGGSKTPDSNTIEGRSCQFVSMKADLKLLQTDSKLKKRKLNDPLSKPPPLKKSAVGTASSTKPVIVKKETKPPVVPTVKDAKADSSFFSAPKPKAKLPSFKKAPAPVQVKKEDANVAQPSAIDPFQDILKSMTKRKESPAVSTPPGSAGTPPQTGVTKNGKKRKSVTWAPDSQLESVRLIEKAIYDDDPVDVSTLLYLCFLYCTLMFFFACFFFVSGCACVAQSPRSGPRRRSCFACTSL